MNHLVARLATLASMVLLATNTAAAAPADFNGWWDASSLGGGCARASALAPCAGTLALLALPLVVGIAVGALCLARRALANR